MNLSDHNLTPNETLVMEGLIDNLYAEPGFSDVCAKDLSKVTKIPTKSIRGVISSLVKKGFIWVSEEERWMGRVEIPALVYLSEEHYDLHPEWSKENA
jgi:DNA-binding MarR family transcriptional regulator